MKRFFICFFTLCLILSFSVVTFAVDGVPIKASGFSGSYFRWQGYTIPKGQFYLRIIYNGEVIAESSVFEADGKTTTYLNRVPFDYDLCDDGECSYSTYDSIYKVCSYNSAGYSEAFVGHYDGRYLQDCSVVGANQRDFEVYLVPYTAPSLVGSVTDIVPVILSWLGLFLTSFLTGSLSPLLVTFCVAVAVVVVFLVVRYIKKYK